jgi:hypothetical protein
MEEYYRHDHVAVFLYRNDRRAPSAPGMMRKMTSLLIHGEGAPLFNIVRRVDRVGQ